MLSLLYPEHRSTSPGGTAPFLVGLAPGGDTPKATQLAGEEPGRWASQWPPLYLGFSWGSGATRCAGHFDDEDRCSLRPQQPAAASSDGSTRVAAASGRQYEY